MLYLAAPGWLGYPHYLLQSSDLVSILTTGIPHWSGTIMWYSDGCWGAKGEPIIYSVHSRENVRGVPPRSVYCLSSATSWSGILGRFMCKTTQGTLGRVIYTYSWPLGSSLQTTGVGNPSERLVAGTIQLLYLCHSDPCGGPQSTQLSTPTRSLGMAADTVKSPGR